MRQMHLLGFLEHGEGVLHALMHARRTRIEDRFQGHVGLQFWQDIARILERGCFDGVFFADTSSIHDRYRGRADEAFQYGINWPRHDPMPTITAMGLATECLGLAVTMSMSSIAPYAAARLLASLDFNTDGRLGWNIVTGNTRSEYEAIGIEAIDHDTRYDHADDFMNICYALWSGIPKDAIVMAEQEPTIADPAKIKPTNYTGKHHQSKGYPLVVPSPQDRPVLFQAGSSGRGQRFAIEHADVVFAIQPDKTSMTEYVTRFRETASAAGRGDIGVMFGLQIVLGSTEEEAKRHHREMIEKLPIEASLARLSGALGVDFSQFDLDSTMEEWPTEASRGLMAAMAGEVEGRKRTLREVAASWAISVGTPHIVGTPGAVAEQLELLWRETGCYGFNVRPTTIPEGLEDFVDSVIPILQAKGIFRREFTSSTFRGNLFG